MENKQRWEYQVIDCEGVFAQKWEGEKISLEDYLNKKGADGWELVMGPSHLYLQCIFKRPIK